MKGKHTPFEGLAGWDRNRQAAFWLNAYNALVLRAVVDHYPIRGTGPQYPSNSIRQIPGAFERQQWRVAGVGGVPRHTVCARGT